MRIAREEIFGPVLAILPWRDGVKLMEDVNAVDYGLTCSIWTRDINPARRTSEQLHAGYVWISEVGKHFLGAPFGGVRQSGIGREECLGELLAYTHEKNLHYVAEGLAATRPTRAQNGAKSVFQADSRTFPSHVASNKGSAPAGSMYHLPLCRCDTTSASDVSRALR